MQRNKYLPLALFALCLISPILLSQAAERISIEPFEVGYRVYRGAIPVGEAKLKLEYPDQDHYRMRSKLRLNDLVRLFSAASVDEEVHGELVDGMPRPLTYRSERDGIKARTISLGFDWTRGKVAATKNVEETILSVQPRTVDPLSLHLLVMLDLRTGSNATEYSVVSGSRLKTYRARMLGKDTTETPLGEFETLVVSRQRLGSSKVTTYWHAPELGFLPVWITKTKDGAEVARLTIREFTKGARFGVDAQH